MDMVCMIVQATDIEIIQHECGHDSFNVDMHGELFMYGYVHAHVNHAKLQCE